MVSIRDAARKPYLRVRGQRIRPRLLHTLHGHTNQVSSLAFVPSSDFVVSGSCDGSCRIWSANEGREVGTQMKNGRDVRAVVVSVDGETMASGGDEGRIVICNLVTRERIIEWDTGHGRVLSLSFSSEGTLASGHRDGNVIVWKVSTGAPTAGPFKLHDGPVRSVSFSPSGDRIAAGDFGTIRVLYSHSGENVIPAIQARSFVRSVVWSPNGHQIISACDVSTIKFWNSSDGSLLGSREGRVRYSTVATTELVGGDTPHSVSSIAISSDGEVLASASYNRTVRLWSTVTHQQISPHLQHPDGLYCVALSSDGHYLAAGGNREVYIWNLRDIPEEAQPIVSDTNKSTSPVAGPATDLATTGDLETPKPNSGDNDASKKTDTDTDKGVPEAHKPPQSESTGADNNSAPNWLDQSAIPAESDDGAGESHYARGGAFWAGREDSLSDPPMKGKGKQKADEGMSSDDLDSAAQRRLFKRMNLKRFKPFKGISNPFKSAHEKTTTLSPPALAEPPEFRSTPSASTGPSGRSESPVPVSSQGRSETLEVVHVSAGRCKKFIMVVPGGKRYPKEMKITKWSMPWIKLAHKRQQLERSDPAPPSASQPTNVPPSQAHSPAEETSPQGDTTDSAQPPAAGGAHAGKGKGDGKGEGKGNGEGEGKGNGEGEDKGKDEDDSGDSVPSTSSRQARPPSETSVTKCDMFLIWLCYPRRVDGGPSL
ncbi:hypothetical protein HYDPIDRAFT_111039, partial [Hydnomerulius pinastri MD-312]